MAFYLANSNEGFQRIKLGTITTTKTFDVSSYGDYKSWTSNNFCYTVSAKGVSATDTGRYSNPEGDKYTVNGGYNPPTMTYTASTGKLKVVPAYVSTSGNCFSVGGSHYTEANASTTVYLLK